MTSMIVKNDTIPTIQDTEGEYPLLTQEEENELATQIQTMHALQKTLDQASERSLSEKDKTTLANGKSARERFILSNLRLVYKIAQNPANACGLPTDVAKQAGMIGLIRAVDEFDPNKKARFSTYAYPTIERAIVRTAIDEGRTIRIPNYLQYIIWKIMKTQDQYMQEHQRLPTEEELAEALEIKSKGVETSLQVMKQRQVSLDYANTPSNGDNPEEQFCQLELIERISATLFEIPARQQRILILAYGLNGKEPLKNIEIGTLLGMTRERVRQLREQALKHLKNIYPELKDLL